MAVGDTLLLAVVVVEPGLNKNQCMDCPPGQKKKAVVER